MNLITNGYESAGDVAIVHASVKENLPDNIVSRGPEEVQKKANNKRETTCLFVGNAGWIQTSALKVKESHGGLHASQWKHFYRARGVAAKHTHDYPVVKQCGFSLLTRDNCSLVLLDDR